MQEHLVLLAIVSCFLTVLVFAAPRADIRALLRLPGFLFRAEVTRVPRKRVRRGRSRSRP